MFFVPPQLLLPVDFAVPPDFEAVLFSAESSGAVVKSSVKITVCEFVAAVNALQPESASTQASAVRARTVLFNMKTFC